MTGSDLESILIDLRVALDKQEDLVDEVAALRTQNKWLFGVMTVAFAALFAVGFVTTIAVRATESAQDAVERVEQVVRDQEADRAAVALSACLVRNGGSRQIRNQFNNAYDVIERVAPGAAMEVDELRNAIPPAEETDRDCDMDGVLTDADYPQ